MEFNKINNFVEQVVVVVEPEAEHSTKYTKLIMFSVPFFNIKDPCLNEKFWLNGMRIHNRQLHTKKKFVKLFFFLPS